MQKISFLDKSSQFCHIILDKNGMHLSSNKKYRELFLLEELDCSKISILNFISELDVETFKATLDDIFKHNTHGYSLKLRMNSPPLSYTPFCIFWEFKPYLDLNGNTIGLEA
ncbi:MAG: hypothetical protein ACXITV_11145 [Luteibaculaceae bacterium]